MLSRRPLLLMQTASLVTIMEFMQDLNRVLRSATETLKKRGINDACIIAASYPKTFTYCREGSSTLWKYLALDLEQQAAILNREKRHLIGLRYTYRASI